MDFQVSYPNSWSLTIRESKNCRLNDFVFPFSPSSCFCSRYQRRHGQIRIQSCCSRRPLCGREHSRPDEIVCDMSFIIRCKLVKISSLKLFLCVITAEYDCIRRGATRGLSDREKKHVTWKETHLRSDFAVSDHDALRLTRRDPSNQCSRCEIIWGSASPRHHQQRRTTRTQFKSLITIEILL